jgi:alkylation response protein AidB-like acyl-CoA dehydrogenase
MNLALTEEQTLFRESTKRFLEAESPLSTVRALWEGSDGFERDYWKQAARLGWTSALVPEAQGGGSVSGRPVSDLVIVAEEMGRVVAPGPFLPVNVVATAIAGEAGPELRSALLPGLLSGDLVAAWAVAEEGAVWSGTAPVIDARVEKRGADLMVSGTKAYVEAAAQAEHFLVTARSAGGLTQLMVPRDTPGLEVIPGRSIDMCRRYGRLHLDGVRVPSAAALGIPGDAGASLERQLQVAIALQCAETVGAAERAFETTIEYARDRFAFGRPVISFQALKHRVADMFQWLEFSKAISEALAAEIDAGGDEAARLASVAKVYVADHCLDIVDECVQISGGIGVTWEHHVHLYSRRIVVNRALFGTPEQHKVRLAALLGSKGRP